MKVHLRLAGLILCACAALAPRLPAAESVGYTDTPKLPGDKWHVHDPNRPQPRVVTPGTFSTAEQPGKPPSDAIVLFDGKDLSAWRNDKGTAAGWLVQDGVIQVPPRNSPGSGDILTREEFGDVQLHLEFAAPNPPKGASQARGNSGIMFMGRYEVQVLDAHNNRTYADGTLGSLYGQHPPLVNAARPPGEWQTYDILFTAPRFKDGKLESPAWFTVFLNGVCVQNHAASLGATVHRDLAKYRPHREQGALRLQDHGDPVRFRNIWIRPLKGYDE